MNTEQRLAVIEKILRDILFELDIIKMEQMAIAEKIEVTQNGSNKK